MLTEKGCASQLDKAVKTLHDERQKIEQKIEEDMNREVIKGEGGLFGFKTLWQKGP